MTLLRSAFVLLIVFALGLWLGPVVATLGWNTILSGIVDAVIRYGAFIFGLLVLAALIYAFRARLSKALFGQVRTRIESVATRIFDAGDLWARALHSPRPRDRLRYGARARRHTRAGLEEFMSAVFFTLGLRSLLGVVIGLTATFAATVGTYLLLQQNEILSRQIQTIQDQALETLYIETLDVLDTERGSTPRAEARASLFLARLPTPTRRAPQPPVSGPVDFSRCMDVKLQSLPEQASALVRLGLSAETIPDRLIDLADLRGDPAKVLSDLSEGGLERALVDDVGVVLVRWPGTTLSRVLQRGEPIALSSFADVHWAGLTLERSRIENSCFDGALLDGSSFYATFMRNVTFVGANLDGANLSEGERRDVDFSGASLRGAYFDQQTLQNVSFDGANLSFARFGADDEEIAFQGVSFAKANLSGVVMTDVEEWQVTGLETACTHPRWPACRDGRVLDLSEGAGRCDAAGPPSDLFGPGTVAFSRPEDQQRHLEAYNACLGVPPE